MREEFSFLTLIVRILAAGAVGGISYLIVCSALRPRGGALKEPVSEYENVLAILIAAAIFMVVLWRLMRGTWSREQVNKLFDVDDAGF